MSDPQRSAYTMNTPKNILQEDESARSKTLEYEKALALLTHSTKRSRYVGIGYLFFAALVAWAARWSFFEVERPVMRSDLFGFFVFALICGTNIWLGISSLCPNPKDAALRNLIEERLSRKF